MVCDIMIRIYFGICKYVQICVSFLSVEIIACMGSTIMYNVILVGWNDVLCYCFRVGYMLPTSPSPWTLPSPLLSPALPVTPNPQGLPPHAAIAAQQSLHHPMISGAAAHYSPTESSGLRQSTGSGNPAPRTGGYFQWPTYTGGRSDYQYFSPSPTLPHPIDASPNSYIHIQSSTIPQLPDFDSVFTSTHT